jgi:type II secretory pathway pseudopilin PulG
VCLPVVAALAVTAATVYSVNKQKKAAREQAAAMQKASAQQNAAINAQTEAIKEQAKINAPTQKDRQEEELATGIETREIMRKRLASSRGFGATRLAGAYAAPNVGKKKLLGQ